MAAESLLNDGVGVVLFLTLLPVAAESGTFELRTVLGMFLVQAVGGAGFGLIVGWIGYRLLRTVDAYLVEIFLTLGIATGGYALANASPDPYRDSSGRPLRRAGPGDDAEAPGSAHRRRHDGDGLSGAIHGQETGNSLCRWVCVPIVVETLRTEHKDEQS